MPRRTPASSFSAISRSPLLAIRVCIGQSCCCTHKANIDLGGFSVGGGVSSAPMTRSELTPKYLSYVGVGARGNFVRGGRRPHSGWSLPSLSAEWSMLGSTVMGGAWSPELPGFKGKGSWPVADDASSSVENPRAILRARVGNAPARAPWPREVGARPTRSRHCKRGVDRRVGATGFVPAMVPATVLRRGKASSIREDPRVRRPGHRVTPLLLVRIDLDGFGAWVRRKDLHALHWFLPECTCWVQLCCGLTHWSSITDSRPCCAA